MELRQSALQVYEICNATEKAHAMHALTALLASYHIDSNALFNAPAIPGRPALPALVAPAKVPRRSPFTTQGHAALIHSIAHIEFNAINLALDAVWRFPGMPQEFYLDWMRVADEEAKHFLMLQNHLKHLGFSYGDFAAHDGLWTLCHQTRNSVIERMALIPRTLEARGLDATPQIQQKLRQVASPQALEAVAILNVILEDEIGHVALGNHWYHWLCKLHGLVPDQFSDQTASKYRAPTPKPPFNHHARSLAGFSESEIQSLSSYSPLQ